MNAADPVTRLNTALEGRYRVERQLGEGGMATVYLARDEKHNRNVALKVLKPELAAVVGADRFLAEIETTANLQHPHILPLHDSGDADGFLFYVMPYVEGESLREKLDRERQLAVDEAVAITTNVAEALDYAHTHGVIHRDIKPANILLQAGKPVISDFGIALALGVAGAGRLTETGLSLGTPHYMSPEQATGDLSVGAATDVYALGCVLYEMLVGEPPYTGSTPQAVLGKIIAGRLLPPTEQRATVPLNVDAALRKALEKVPADRFASAQDFARALAAAGFRHGLVPAGAVEPSAVSPWTRLSTTLAGATALLAVVLGWALLRPLPPVPVTRQYMSTDGWAFAPGLIGRRMAVAPDGSSMILPIEVPAGDIQLGLKMRSSIEITPLSGTEGALDPVYSPDGQWIAYVVGQDLFKRPLVGGSPLRLVEGSIPAGVEALDWLDDGTILFEEEGGEGVGRRIARISENGGESDVVLWYEDVPLSPVWVHGLPGGRGALVVACPAPGSCPAPLASVYVVDLESLTSRVLFDGAVRVWYAPTGHIVYVQTDGAVVAQPFDVRSLELTGPALPLFDGVRVASGQAAFADMVLGDDGTLVYGLGQGAAAIERRLVMVDLEGNEEPLLLPPRMIGPMDWSPDGRSIVFNTLPTGDLGGLDVETTANLYAYNVELGTTPRQLTFQGANFRLVLSPDGSRVIYASLRNVPTDFDLYIKNLDDDEPASPLLTLPEGQWPTDWPSDGVVVMEYGAPADLWILDLSDPDEPVAEPYLTSEATLEDIRISPDGALAAYVSNETGVREVYIRRFPDPGERIPVSEGGGLTPAWSPDGRTVYYWRAEGPPGVNTLFAAQLQLVPTPAVLSRDSLFTGSYDQQYSELHPDGNRFIVPQERVASSNQEDTAGGSGPIITVTNFFEELRQRVGGG